MPYNQVLPYLLKGGSVTLKEQRLIYPLFSPGYDVNSMCDYYMGASGHTVDNYKRLKHKVLDLIDSMAITYTPSSPNIKTNSMSTNAGPSANVVKESDNQKLVIMVEEIQIPMLVIKEQLMKLGLISANYTNYENFVNDPETCERLKSCIEQFINQEIVQIGHLIKDDEEVATQEIPYSVVEVQIPLTPLSIQVPASFPYESTQVVP